MTILVGLRDSKLALKQFEEVLTLLGSPSYFQPTLVKTIGDSYFKPILMKTIGDKHLDVSLKEMDKTDFFTRDIDQMQLQGKCRIAIHSAKDLPEPLPKGLQLVALTAGQDPSDSLVLRAGESLTTLPQGARIGSSSFRRDQALKKLRPDLTPVPVRGPIDARLEKLFQGEIDGLIVAEAALIRLELTSLNRIFLNSETAPLQGQLAIIAREGDREMEALFAPINTLTSEKTCPRRPST